LNYQKFENPKWDCNFKSGIYSNDAPYSIEKFDIDCEQPDGSHNKNLTHFKENKCVMSYNLKFEEDSVAFKSIPWMVFKKDEKTKAKQRPFQINCIDKDGEDYCSKSKLVEVNCTNSNFNQSEWASWWCTLKPEHIFNGSSVNVEVFIDVYNLVCQYPDGTEFKKIDNNGQSYFKADTCSIDYNVRLNSKYDDSLDEYGNKKENGKDDSPTESGSTPLIVFLLMLPIIAIIGGYIYYQTKKIVPHKCEMKITI